MHNVKIGDDIQSVQDKSTKGGRWHDLETKGYVVVPSFLSEEDIRFLLTEFESANKFPNAPTYKMVSPTVLDAFRPKLMETVEEIKAEIGLQADLITGSVYFAISLGTDLGWHQDHESFYQFGEHYHYLNFYIPFQKPIREKSNLSVVPLDALAEVSPKAYRQRLKKGACVASPFHGKTIMKDHERGGFSVFGFDIDKIGVTPDLGAGDLLLLRGDVFHKTQDTETDRIAISFRMVKSDTSVRRKNLVRFGMSLHKFLAHSKNRYRRARYAKWSAPFDETNKSELTAAEYVSILQGSSSRREKGGGGSWPSFVKTMAKNWFSA